MAVSKRTRATSPNTMCLPFAHTGTGVKESGRKNLEVWWNTSGRATVDLVSAHTACTHALPIPAHRSRVCSQCCKKLSTRLYNMPASASSASFCVSPLLPFLLACVSLQSSQATDVWTGCVPFIIIIMCRTHSALSGSKKERSVLHMVGSGMKHAWTTIERSAEPRATAGSATSCHATNTSDQWSMVSEVWNASFKRAWLLQTEIHECQVPELQNRKCSFFAPLVLPVLQHSNTGARHCLCRHSRKGGYSNHSKPSSLEYDVKTEIRCLVRVTQPSVAALLGVGRWAPADWARMLLVDHESLRTVCPLFRNLGDPSIDWERWRALRVTPFGTERCGPVRPLRPIGVKRTTSVLLTSRVPFPQSYHQTR